MKIKAASEAVRGLFVLTYNGAPADAAGTPTGAVYRNGVLDGTVAVTVTNLATGLYSYSYTIPAGYAANDDVDVVLSGVVNSDAFKVLGESVVVRVADPTAAAIVTAIKAEVFGAKTLTNHLTDLGTSVGNIPTAAAPTANQVRDAVWANVIDGLAASKYLEALLACCCGVATVSGSTVSFKKRDGSTEVLSITYGSTDGQRTASTIT